MKDLDIIELCQLQALLIRYKHELVQYEFESVEMNEQTDEAQTAAIDTTNNMLGVVMDDIAFRCEQ